MLFLNYKIVSLDYLKENWNFHFKVELKFKNYKTPIWIQINSVNEIFGKR